ncbi:MAG: peptidase S8, partial [Gammaproteobacteria bacterium]
MAAATTCVDNGAKVINMSFGGSMKSRTEARAFADLAAQGVLSIAAAGNDGNNRNSYPASYDAVVSVAALDH